MAHEKFKNNATTTLSGSVNNSSDPVTVAVVSASLFPTTGNFHIKIDSEILLVTGVSGTNFTAVRAREGTTIASHSSGAAVKLVLTNESLDNTINDRFLVGIADNYTAEAAKLYQCSDVPVAVINQTHLIRSPYMPIHTWDETTYTWFSQGGSTVSKKSDFAAAFTIPHTAGEQLRGMFVAFSGSITIDAWFDACLIATPFASYNLFGVTLGNGSNAKKYVSRIMTNPGTSGMNVIGQYFTDDTTATATPGQYDLFPGNPVCLRLAYDSGGNTVDFAVSTDGINFLTYGQRTSVSSDFTPNRAGVVFENNSGLACVYNVYNVYIR